MEVTSSRQHTAHRGGIRCMNLGNGPQNTGVISATGQISSNFSQRPPDLWISIFQPAFSPASLIQISRIVCQRLKAGALRQRLARELTDPAVECPLLEKCGQLRAAERSASVRFRK